MNINTVFPTRFVSAADLNGKPVTVTIKSATLEEMGHGTEKQTKLVLWFEKATKGLVLNKTNAFIIGAMYGAETDNWVGCRITLYPTRVKAFGTVQDAIRVREQMPAQATAPAHVEEAQLDDDADVVDNPFDDEVPTIHS